MKQLERIMHVDDEDDIREVTRFTLEAMGGFEVMSCASGAEALENITAFAPDLLLLDVMMPGMDGPATLAALRDLSGIGNVPVIFMTAKVQTTEVERFKALGALDVLTKPFDPEALVDTLNAVWNIYNG